MLIMFSLFEVNLLKSLHNILIKQGDYSIGLLKELSKKLLVLEK
jgi:hypothetical protein